MAGTEAPSRASQRRLLLKAGGAGIAIGAVVIMAVVWAASSPPIASQSEDSNRPKDPKILAAIADAEGYFEKPEGLWDACQRCAARLNKAGHFADASEIVTGASDAMKRLGMQPKHDQKIPWFIDNYESRRIEAYWGGGRASGPATHAEGVDLLVRDQKFGNVEK